MQVQERPGVVLLRAPSDCHSSMETIVGSPMCVPQALPVNSEAPGHIGGIAAPVSEGITLWTPAT